MQKKNKNLQAVIEVAIFSAIAVALDMVQGSLFKGLFPNGGSIGIAMLPIFIVSYRRGLGWGILSGFIVSLLQMLPGVYAINRTSFDNPFMQAMGPFIQICLDYVLAYTVCGFAGLFRKKYIDSQTSFSKGLYLSLGCVLGGLLKYACHVISGIAFWLGDGSSSFMNVNNSTNLYSFIYNGAFCIPNIIICAILLVIVGIKYSFLLTNIDLQIAEGDNE